MIDRTTFLTYSKEEYKEYLFPDKKEFYRFRDMFLACKAISFCHTNEMVGWVNPKTVQFCDLYKKEITNSIEEFQGVREKYGYLLPMRQMRDNLEFQKKFKEHTEYLANIMRDCIVDYNPAEKVLSEPEICFVLYSHPELVKHVKKQTCDMQEILFKKGKARYVKNPDSSILRNVNANTVQSVPFNQRDIDFEVSAVMDGKLPIKDIHFKKLPEYLTKHINTIPSYRFEPLVKGIEELGVQTFGENVMEQMRLLFVEYEDPVYGTYCCQWSTEPVLTYMKNPSKKVKEASVRKNPYSVGVIKYQYDAIQDLALHRCKELHDSYFDTWKNFWRYNDDRENPWLLLVLWECMIKNPSVKIQKIYKELTGDKQYW